MKTYNMYDLCIFLDLRSPLVTPLLEPAGILNADGTPTEYALRRKAVIVEDGEVLFTARAINAIKDTKQYKAIPDNHFHVLGTDVFKVMKAKPTSQKRKGLMG